VLLDGGELILIEYTSYADLARQLPGGAKWVQEFAEKTFGTLAGIVGGRVISGLSLKKELAALLSGGCSKIFGEARIHTLLVLHERLPARESEAYRLGLSAQLEPNFRRLPRIKFSIIRPADHPSREKAFKGIYFEKITE
jgi:hypothetical protein